MFKIYEGLKSASPLYKTNVTEFSISNEHFVSHSPFAIIVMFFLSIVSKKENFYFTTLGIRKIVRTIYICPNTYQTLVYYKIILFCKFIYTNRIQITNPFERSSFKSEFSIFLSILHKGKASSAPLSELVVF